MNRQKISLLIDKNPQLRLVLESEPLIDVGRASRSFSHNEQKKKFSDVFSFIRAGVAFIPSSLFFHVLFFWVPFSKVKGIKLSLIPFWIYIYIYFFCFLNSHSKVPHQPTSHPSHLPAASISKFLRILEYYINFTELLKTKFILINTSVASLKAFANSFPQWV